MTEAEIRRQVEAEIAAWLRGEASSCGEGDEQECRALFAAAAAIEAQEYHHPDIPRN